MKKPLCAFFLCVSASHAFAIENAATITGRECTIDTYDSNAESSGVGGFDGDSFVRSYRTLMDQLRASRFIMRRKDPNHRVHYFKDTEFLVQLRMDSGRGSKGRVSLELMNTGRYGTYQTLFYIETRNSGDPDADAQGLIKALPECVLAR